MVRIPVSLDDWSLDLVRELVATLDGEPSWLDFKEFLSAPGSERADNKNSIRRTAAGMANADGGFIVFGVGDAQKYPAPETRICGIALNSENRKQFNEKLSNIFPSLIGFGFKPLPIADGNGVLVVHMPTSTLRPHMLWDEGYFPTRGEGGSTGKMSVQEVREQMLGGEERRRKGQLLTAKVVQYREMAEEIAKFEGMVQNYYGTFDTPFFDTLVMDLFGIPLGGSLLRQLMNVSGIAGRINTLLQIARTPFGGSFHGLPGNAPIKLQDDLRELMRECDGCRQRLEALFGPLPPALG